MAYWFQPVGKNVAQPLRKSPPGLTVMKYSGAELAAAGTSDG